jgi:ATP-dependent Zn protease
MDETQLDAVFSEIEEERRAREDFQRSHYSERITNRLDDTFRELGLQDAYASAARKLAQAEPGLDDLVEKAMRGEEVMDQEIRQTAESVKQATPPWFQESGGFPGAGEASEEMTHEERVKRADLSHYAF